MKKEKDIPAIVWSDETWNPVINQKTVVAEFPSISAEILDAMGEKEVIPVPDALDTPKRWRRPRIVRVISADDIFHSDISDDYIDEVMAVIRETPLHTYKVCTKCAERMAGYFATKPVPSNLWLGVAVDVLGSETRIDFLRQIPANQKFISHESAGTEESVGGFDLDGINWLLLGDGLAAKIG